jgi:hypothetical protein
MRHVSRQRFAISCEGHGFHGDGLCRRLLWHKKQECISGSKASRGKHSSLQYSPLSNLSLSSSACPEKLDIIEAYSDGSKTVLRSGRACLSRPQKASYDVRNRIQKLLKDQSSRIAIHLTLKMDTVSKHSFRTELGECDFHQQPHEAFAYSGISHLESGDVWNIIRPRHGLCSPGSCETCSAPSCRLTPSGTYIGRGTWLSIGSERKEYLVDYNLPYVDVCKDFIEFAIRESLRHNDTQALHILCRPWATDEQILANARRESCASSKNETKTF